MSLSVISLGSGSGVAGTSTIGSQFPGAKVFSVYVLPSGGRIGKGFVTTGGCFSVAMGLVEATIPFSSGAGRASRALH
ncbi:hypothetical protein IC582_022780 [Cucumis melo]